jgi:hypothetical protein
LHRMKPPPKAARHTRPCHPLRSKRRGCSSFSLHITSERLGSPYRSGRSKHWVKIKNPKGPAVRNRRMRPVTHARPEQNNDQNDECAVEQVFPVIVHPDGLTPLLPRKNVQREPAERDHGDHQKSSGQNNVIHDNASFVVVAKTQIDAGNLGFRRQSTVRLRQRKVPKRPPSLCSPDWRIGSIIWRTKPGFYSSASG